MLVLQHDKGFTCIFNFQIQIYFNIENMTDVRYTCMYVNA